MIKTTRFADETSLAHGVLDALVTAFAGPYSSPTAVMLAGGSTPLAAYALLATERRQIDPHLIVFFSDDRHVPPDHPQSNFGNIVPFLHRCGILDNYVIRVHGELPLQDAVRDYDEQLAAFLKSGGRIALGLLGLGTDGHTASLFSKDDIEQGKSKRAVGVDRPDGLQGVSVTPSVLTKVERLVFVVSGAGKKAMAKKLVRNPAAIAAGLAVSGHRCVELWADKPAAP